MRIYTVSLFLGLNLFFASASFAEESDSTPTPPNQSDVKVEKSSPKAGVTGVQTQSAGPHSGSGSLDPSRQSSMGLGIQIPLHKEKEAPPANSETKDGDASKQ